MKKFVKYNLLTAFVSVMLIIGFFLGIVAYPQNVFQVSYQSAIQDKFDVLMNTNEPKIIILGGSSAAFGINQQLIEMETGYKVVNLGVHADFGCVFYAELSKANINAGDIVLIGYEYGWNEQGAFSSIGTDLVMSGIDSKLEMYRYIPCRFWPSILGYLPEYAEKKNEYIPIPSGCYTRTAFDKSGQMIYVRDGELRNYNEKDFGRVKIENAEISGESIAYLGNYADYVYERGAKVYFIAPPLLKDALICDTSLLRALADNEEMTIGIPYISDPVDYLYPGDLMYDTIYHCNNKGELVRTLQLIEDMINAGIVPKDK